MKQKTAICDFSDLFATRKEPYKTNHNDIVEKVHMNTGIPLHDVKKVINAIPFSIKDSLQVEGDKVTIKGIGTWSLVEKKVRRNLKNSVDSDYSLGTTFTKSRTLVPYTLQKKKENNEKK